LSGSPNADREALTGDLSRPKVSSSVPPARIAFRILLAPNPRNSARVVSSKLVSYLSARRWRILPGNLISPSLGTKQRKFLSAMRRKTELFGKHDALALNADFPAGALRRKGNSIHFRRTAS
jgi:hypothetical protein